MPRMEDEPADWVGEPDGFVCYIAFCRAAPFDTPDELEEHRHAEHPELYEEEEDGID